MSVNERAVADTRANAHSDVVVTLDPPPATTDLREIRAAVKQALIRQREVPSKERAAMFYRPLLVLVPSGSSSGSVAAVRPASSSHPTSVWSTRPPAGQMATPSTSLYGNAEYFVMKILYPGRAKAMMYPVGGPQFLFSGRARGQVFVSQNSTGADTSWDGPADNK